MDLETLLTELTHPNWWLIVGVGLGVGFLAFRVGRILLEMGWGWSKAMAFNRRATPRREGTSVEVDLFDPEGQIDPIPSFVWDRSRGGIGLVVPVQVPIGIVLNAHPKVNWNEQSVPVEVLTCRRNREGYLLGCKFVQTPP